MDRHSHNRPAHSLIFGVVVACGVLLGTSSNVFGQETGKASVARSEASLSHRDNLPSSIAAASVALIDHTGSVPVQIRTIQVYPEDQNSKVRVPGRYYHRPLFAFVEDPAPHPGYPAIVHEVDSESDDHGSIILKFLVRISTADLRAECRRAVLASDRANALQAAGTEERVMVQPWPLEHMIIVCRNAASQEVLGSVSTGGLSGTGDDLSFWMRFTPDALEKFKRSVEKKRIEFVFYYTYVGMQTVRGSVSVKGDKDVGAAVRNVLRSDQVQGSAPIFQGDRNAVARHLSVRMEKTIRAEHKDLIPLLSSSGMMERMFEPAQTLSLQELARLFGNQKMEEQLAAYLKPLIVNLNETRTENDLRYDIKEGETATPSASGRGFNVFGLVFGSRSKEATERALNRLENATGATFAKAQNEEVYRPHQITIWKLRAGWDKTTFDETTQVYLKIGSESTYIEDTGVPAWFTDTLAATSISLNLRGYIDRRLAEKAACLEGLKAAREELGEIHEQQTKLIEEIESLQRKLEELGGSGEPSGYTSPAGVLTSLRQVIRVAWSGSEKDSTQKVEPARVAVDGTGTDHGACDVRVAAISRVLKGKIATLTLLDKRVAILRETLARQNAMVQEIDKELMVVIKR